MIGNEDFSAECESTRRAMHESSSIANLQRIIQTDPDNAAAWLELYLAFVDSDLIDDAASHLERWLEVRPGNELATYLLPSLKELPTPERAPRAFTTSRFAAASANYEQSLKSHHYRGPVLFQQLLTNCLGDATQYRQLAQDRRVVDLGCGTGAIGTVLRSYADTLLGVDLSTEMLAIASQAQLYDQLECAELVEYLQESPKAFDLIVAAECFSYFGNLSQLIPLCFSALKKDGWLVFSLQEGPLIEDGYYLLPDGSFMHSPQYLIEQLGEAGLTGGNIGRVVLRESKKQNKYALLIAVQRPDAS